MLKALSKIILSCNQMSLLALEDSNLLTCNNLSHFNTHLGLKDERMKSIFEDDLSPTGHLSHSANIQKTLIEYNDLPSYLSNSQNIEYKYKINTLINSFSSEKVTPQNMKILNLAFGFKEKDFNPDASNRPNNAVEQTEESNVGLATSKSNKFENGYY